MNFKMLVLSISLVSIPILFCQEGFTAEDQERISQSQIRKQESEIRNLVDQYAKTLGPYQDPFAWVFNPEQGNQLFQRLSMRPAPTEVSAQSEPPTHGSWVESSLGKIRNRLQQDTSSLGTSSKPVYDDTLVESILVDARSLLPASPNDQDYTELQSNLLALKYTQEYLRRYKIVRPEDNPEVPKEKKSKEQSETELKYPELPKDVQNLDEISQFILAIAPAGNLKQNRIGEVNFKTPFFSQRYFSEINRLGSVPFREVPLPTTFLSPGKFRDTGRELILKLIGKKKVDLFLPPQYVPVQPSNPRASISRSESGGYVLSVQGDLEEVHIPLVQESGVRLTPPVYDAHIRKVGFGNQEWPDGVQIHVLRKFSSERVQNQTLQIAQAIANHISNEYQYKTRSLTSSEENDPIDALKAGSFQSEMASFIMISLLRDAYKIPSRIVGGFRAKSHQSAQDGKSYLIHPSTPHWWVEVFHDGKWHAFDPTPIKKARKDQKEPGQVYSDRLPENTPRQKESEGGTNNGDKSNNLKTGQILGGTQDQGQNDAQKLTHEQNQNQEINQGQSDNLEINPAGEMTLDELANQLEIGSLELEPRLDRNALLERVIRVLLQVATNPTQNGTDIQNRLNRISSILGKSPSIELKRLYQEASTIHEGEHPPLKSWIDQLVRIMASQDINHSYQVLYRIRKTSQIFSQVLDRNVPKIPVPENLLEKLLQAQRILESLAHPDSQDIALVQELVKNLPSVPRLLLKNQFDLTRVGPNAPTREISRQLKNGNLNDLRLISNLSPMSDFILNSSPRPEMLEVKTWQRNLTRPRGREILPLQRFSDLPRAIWGQPGKSPEENIQQGTAYVLAKRKRVYIPAGYGREEAERITILLYDTSGSMQGEAGRFQAGLISAFTGRALSDLASSGRHRHRVVLVPFDDEVGIPVSVTNTQDALEVIRNYQKNLGNTGGGTDIQKALLQAMALIADAEKRAGEPLAAANIVLMTDGQAPIQAEELLQARKAIDRNTPLQTLFIAIAQTNEELMKFAMDSQSMGAERGFYREFTWEQIIDILHQADHLDPEKIKGAFFSETLRRDIPAEVYELLHQAVKDAGTWSDQIHAGSRFTPARDHLQDMEKLKWQETRSSDRPLERWLIQVRQLVLHPAFQDRELLERVVDDLINHFERLSGVKLCELSGHEQEQLRHLVRFAAGLENGL